MKKTATPLYDAVKKYVGSRPTRFHMPGHKGKGGGLYKSAKFDVTELDFSDDLLKSEGVIKESEQLFADTYGVDSALIFTTGATGGLFATLYAVKCRTDKLILSKNSHKSVFNAMSVLGIEPCFIDVEYGDGLPNVLTANKVKEAIDRYPDAGAVLITTPDYFGRIVDINAIKEAIGSRMLVADSAHGAHFVYTSDLVDRVENVADIAVLSMHKTLPCFTGGAIVTAKEDYVTNLKKGRRLFHTSSPQYLTMVSMDYARGLMTQKGVHGYRKMKEKLAKFNFQKLDNYDYTKLVLKGGVKLEQKLKSCGIYPECVCGDWVVLILTIGDERYLKKVYKIAKSENQSVVDTNYFDAPRLERVCKFSECISCETKAVDIENSVGEVLAEEVGLYPPGVPQFFRGERITEEGKEFLLKHKKSLFGVDSNKVIVLK